MKRPPSTDTDALAEYLPHGCTCEEGDDATACARCVANRERIRRLYAVDLKETP